MSKAGAASGRSAQDRAAKPKPPYARPMSPHLQVWRWHVTMLGSILHRVSGVGLYFGAVLVTAWLAALAAGPQAYDLFLSYAAHPLALVVWIGLSACVFYHFASGLRHLVWDLGAGLAPRTADALATLSIWFGVIATIVFWAALFIAGKVSL